MEQDEIVENNQLIIKFMGYEYCAWNSKSHRCNHYTSGYWGIKGATLHNRKLQGSMIVNPLLYHLSWDWLMPVVERIEAINGVQIHIKGNSVDIFWFGFSRSKGITENKKHSIWTAVVGFIKWYNAHCQTVSPTGDGCVERGQNIA